MYFKSYRTVGSNHCLEKKKEDGSGIVPVEHTCWCKGLLLSLKSFNLYGAHSRRRWSPCMRLLQGKENKSQKFNLQMV